MIYLKNEILFDRDYFCEIDDLKRVQKALFVYRDIFVSMDEAAVIWQTYSSNLCASWLYLPEKDEDIPKQIESDDYFKGWHLDPTII